MLKNKEILHLYNNLFLNSKCLDGQIIKFYTHIQEEPVILSLTTEQLKKEDNVCNEKIFCTLYDSAPKSSDL